MTPRSSTTRGRRRPSRYELRLEAEARERARNLAELMADLRHARETEAEWYMWILNGRPVLTEAEYALVGRHGRSRPRSSSSTPDRAELDDRADDLEPQGTLA